MQTDPTERLNDAHETLLIAQLAYSENPSPIVWKGVIAAREAIEQATLAKEGADRKVAREAEEANAKARGLLETQLVEVSAQLAVDAPVKDIAAELTAALALIAEAYASWNAAVSDNSAKWTERADILRQLGKPATFEGECRSSMESRLARLLGSRNTADSIKATRATLDAFAGVLNRSAAADAEREDRRGRLRSELVGVNRRLALADSSVTHWKRQLSHSTSDAHFDPNSQEAFKSLRTATESHEQYVEIRAGIAAEAARLTRDIEALS